MNAIYNNRQKSQKNMVYLMILCFTMELSWFYYHTAIGMLLLMDKLNLKYFVLEETKELWTVTQMYITIIILIFIFSVTIIIVIIIIIIITIEIIIILLLLILLFSLLSLVSLSHLLSFVLYLLKIWSLRFTSSHQEVFQNMCSWYK